jgi:hypothetical protein
MCGWLRRVNLVGELQLRRVSLLPVRGVDEDQQQTVWIFFAADYRVFSRGGPHKNHTWEICHLARPIPGVESAGRRESVAGAPRKCGFVYAGALAWRKIHVWREMVCLACLVCERASF